VRPRRLAMEVWALEYHDVHAIDQPELRKTFKSLSKMKAWFKEHASKTKGQAR
jgi:hypothetical protein